MQLSMQSRKNSRRKIILPYFDRNKETILQTDASKKGFGAVILQEEQPIYYASRALTSAEKNYQNLEREAQAAVWGMEKFHYFLYGRKFILQTDQKPLVSIFRKHMIDVSPRIQRITIRAWQYDFIPQHIPGRINVIADFSFQSYSTRIPGFQCRKGYSSSELSTVFFNRRKGER